MISKATSDLEFWKTFSVILLSKGKCEIPFQRNNCFGLSLVMVAYVLKGLFTYTNRC